MPGFAGFDSYSYPGDAELAWLSANTNLEWCGYYLAPAPSHQDTSWMGKLVALKAAGWGVAPVYLGEQVTGPGSRHPNAAKGATDGANAADLMTSEGFPAGSCVFLDLENGLPFPAELQAYTTAWCQAVQDAGFQPGVYCSHALAAQVHTLFPAARVWAFRIPTLDSVLVPSPFPSPDPAGCGYAKAYMWQLQQNCQLSVELEEDVILRADLSSALAQDPGAPDASSATV
jgi:hypothetical protein